MKPLIGLVADVHAGGKHVSHTVQQKYLHAVAAGANAIAIIIPAGFPTWPTQHDQADLLAQLDAICLTGALSNVDPALYDTPQADPNSPADPARDAVTLPLIRAAVAIGLPVLGICRGCQEINVALGGTLHQQVHAIPGYADHRELSGTTLPEQYAPSHAITLTPGGMLAQLSGLQTAQVNSLHGQGIATLAPTLAADATAPDGLIEAVRATNPNAFLLGVQWHPEWHFDDDPLSTVIFRALGTAARAREAARTRHHAA